MTTCLVEKDQSLSLWHGMHRESREEVTKYGTLKGANSTMARSAEMETLDHACEVVGIRVKATEVCTSAVERLVATLQFASRVDSGMQ